MSEQVEPRVGQRIRALRELRGLSLRALAARSGLSLNAISLIERGENSPTVSSLHLLATALGVSITELFQDEHEQAVVFVRPEARLSSEANGVALESLGIGLRNQQLEPFLIRIAPQAGTSEQPVSHAGEEFVYCLEGVVDYFVGERAYRLEQGRSLLFQASLDHYFQNRQQAPALLLMVFYVGTGGHRARQLHLASSLVADDNSERG